MGVRRITVSDLPEALLTEAWHRAAAGIRSQQVIRVLVKGKGGHCPGAGLGLFSAQDALSP
ncbi:hypothetical protein FLM9_1086 [Candidatus Synechococcus spongiarum]|uniref:Uncharacterized protein n=1 Tax=Candidatus Synechococcus spongiarum TaxID=431041 RepID=A0A171DGZ8_9SYNE|nr:hypothetical protein FLM9_1086 [Candidatus Synechococcus spongiarum]